MRAYMTPLDRNCEYAGCPRFASRKVVDFHNTLGIFCNQHAEMLVNAFNAQEQKENG